MDLTTISEIAQPNDHEGTVEWRDGDAWLAGGTWLFSEPQPHLRRLIDLQSLGWRPISITAEHLEIAATCTIAELYSTQSPADWTAAPLIRQCCDSFVSSFKVWNSATVGGNICMSLPAGPMISLATALDGVCAVRTRSGDLAAVPVQQFVVGNHKNILRPGDLLTRIDIPLASIRQRSAFRRISLTHLGRSTALLIGTWNPVDETFKLTVTAATERPYRFRFQNLPDARDLRSALKHGINSFFDDVHGSPEYREHMTYYLAEEIRRELAG